MIEMKPFHGEEEIVIYLFILISYEFGYWKPNNALWMHKIYK